MHNVVFLPGVNNAPEVWQPIIDSITVPLKATALSLPPLNSVEEIADQLATSMTEPVAIVGHSFGGMVALAILERHPELVSGIVLVASRATGDSETAREKRLQRAEVAREKGHLDSLIASRPTTFHEDFLRDEALWRQRVQHAEQYGTERYVAHQVAMANQPDRTQVLIETSIPKLVIVPDSDTVISPQAQQDLASRSQSDCVTVPRSGHLLPAERPDAVAAALDNWLQNNTGRALSAT